MNVLAQVLVALLVTVGVLSIMEGLRRWLLLPPQITVTVWVTTATDVENLDILLGEAVRYTCRRAGIPVIVLVPHDLLYGVVGLNRKPLPQVQEILDNYGALLCVVEGCET